MQRRNKVVYNDKQTVKAHIGYHYSSKYFKKKKEN